MKLNKIFHISANQYPQLPENHHSKVIWNELSKTCDEYHIFARSLDMSFSHTKEGKLHLHLVPCFGSRQFVFLFLSMLLPFYFMKYKTTHVIVQCPVLGGFIAAAFKKIFKYELFVEIHGEHYFLPVKAGLLGDIHHNFFKKITRFSLKRADKIRSLSSTMSESLVAIYGNNIANKITIIPNRVDLDIFNIVKSEYEIETDLKVISVGRFSKLKNHSNLIKDLYASGIKFHLTIVGSGELKSEFYALAESLGSINDLTVLENIPHSELSEILPLNDVYIHYSLSEGVPRAILEAMACGLPVISTNVGYINDLLEHQVNSIVIDLPYKENLIDSLPILIDSALQRKILGRNARLTIEKNHEWNLVFDLYREEIKNCKAGVN
jgi:glycosyltransferase involved in cell wall biosynthesis